MAWQDVAAVLDAKGTFEETFYQVTPSAEDDNDEPETCPLNGREPEIVDTILFCEMPYKYGNQHHKDAATNAPLPTLAWRDAREEFVLAQQRTTDIGPRIVDPKEYKDGEGSQIAMKGRAI